MTAAAVPTRPHPRRLARSVGAVAAGFAIVAGLSLAADQLFHVLGVYPPWGEPMHDPGDNVLALAYRIAFTILGGYVTARLAPHAPVRHAIILGIIGTVLAFLGAVATITQFDFGPDWYPISLVITALPCTWVGGRIGRHE